MEEVIEFEAFPKIARISRDMIITEKLDGTNAQIFIDDLGKTIRAGSRTKWITPESDNYGFARWVETNKEDLMQLGPGRHYGEWWGSKIQRKYGLDHKRFSLFNTTRWAESKPDCCHVVPVLYEGPFRTSGVEVTLAKLKIHGSYASPEFMNPEGIVIFHVHANMCFKKTILNDETPKSLV